MPDKEEKVILYDKYGDEILSEVTITHSSEMKRVSKTKYKYVYIVSYNGVKTYRAELCKLRFNKCFSILRDAALAVDKKLMENKIDPVNILKKKIC